MVPLKVAACSRVVSLKSSLVPLKTVESVHVDDDDDCDVDDAV